MTPWRPNLVDLELLVLIARAGSMGQAAATCGLTQPNLSRRMIALERRLKVKVLQRSPRGTTLTPAGRVVVDWASALLATADEFERSVATLRSPERSAVRAGASMTIAEHCAPMWLGALRSAVPGAVVSLVVANSSEVASRVASGDLDIGFVESPEPPRALAGRRIGGDTLAVAVPADHSWARRARVPAAELATAQLLVREHGSGTRETLEAAFAARGLRVRPAMEMASNAALASASVAGMGPVVLSELSLAQEFASGSLVRVDVPDLDLSRPFTAIWRPRSRLPNDAVALLNTVCARSAAPPASQERRTPRP
jgi:DNA-binding transcriptional LysR family regulator